MSGKVSIITLHYVKNYGSVLQTYATQTVFERLGYKAEFVDYVRPNERVVEHKKSFKEKAVELGKRAVLKATKGESFDKEDHIFKDFVDAVKGEGQVNGALGVLVKIMDNMGMELRDAAY